MYEYTYINIHLPSYFCPNSLTKKIASYH